MIYGISYTQFLFFLSVFFLFPSYPQFQNINLASVLYCVVNIDAFIYMRFFKKS
jgi:hypothetical protein